MKIWDDTKMEEVEGKNVCQRAKCCSNLICSRHSLLFGYICEKCYRELATYAERGHVQTYYHVRRFISTPKSELLPKTHGGRLDITKLFHKEE